MDTSALIVVMNLEPERIRFLEIIAASGGCLISTVTLFEARMVTFGQHGTTGVLSLADWLATFEPEIVPFDKEQSEAAFTAFRIYGKGNHPKARLNICDCAAYALAKTRNLPLLFKGADFAATDLVAAA